MHDHEVPPSRSSLELQLAVLQRLMEQAASVIGLIRRGSGEQPLDENETSVSPTAESPCTNCPQRPTCAKPCERLESLLPSLNAGASRRIQTTDVPLHVVAEAEVTTASHRLRVLDRFEPCWHLLSEDQARAIELVYREGLSQQEAAQSLGISPAAMSGRMARARRIMEAHFLESKKSAHRPR